MIPTEVREVDRPVKIQFPSTRCATVAKRTSLDLRVIGCLLMGASVAAEVHFHDLGVDEALERAAAEEKVVFVDFFTTWCLPCKEMDETTFKDSDVASWLAENTVALKVDAEANEANQMLAERYGVRSFPNYVFISPNGDVMDRITGKRLPEEFIKDGESVLRGENAIARARRALSEGNPKNPMLRSKLADAFVEMGQDEAALREYLWCFDEGEQHSPAYHGVRLSFLLGSIKSLGDRYPPARAALIKRRQEAEQRIVDGSAEYDDIAMYAAINRTFGDQDASVDLYDQVKGEGSLTPLALEAFADQVFELLVHAQRYHQVALEYDVPGKVDEAFDSYRNTMEAFGDIDSLLDELDGESMQKELAAQLESPGFLDSMLLGQKLMLRQQVVICYQVLVGAGVLEDAAKAAQRLIEELDDAETHNALAWAGYITGAPVEANLVQARRAFEMTEGKDIAIVDTLARLLADLGHLDEAVSIAEEAWREAETSRDRQIMVYCLEYLDDHPAADPDGSS